jgi:ribonuclease HI
MVRDYRWCNHLNADTQTVDRTWAKLSTEWIKCNVDCALFEVGGQFGVGICFRDNLGHLLQDHSLTFPYVATTAKCVATALQQAIQIALDKGLNRVIFETDCQVVANVVLSNNLYVNELGSLLSTCRTLLASNASYTLAFIRRQANRVAHSLARASILHASPSIFYHPPYCIHSLIMDEMK